MSPAAAAQAQAGSKFSDSSTQFHDAGSRPVVVRSRRRAAASGWSRPAPVPELPAPTCPRDGNPFPGRLRRSAANRSNQTLIDGSRVC